jgi:uncharacterized membrane protein
MAQVNIQGCGITPHSTRRLIALDVARGIALVFACTAHFPLMYFLGPHAQDNSLFLVLLTLTKVATPTFIFVSSIVLGYLCSSPHKNGPQFRLRLFSRIAFLATVGHCLMAATLKESQDFLTAMSRGYVTDTIAYCVIGSLLVLPYAKAATRMQMSVGLYLISFAGWALWHPDNSVLMLLRGIFFGPDATGATIFAFPLLPWFAVYLGGTSVGEWLSRFKGYTLALAGKKLAIRSGVVLCVAGLMYGSLRVFLAGHHTAGLMDHIRVLVSPTSKYPPGPGYLLVFGSMALLLIGGVIWKMGETHSVRDPGHRRYLRILEQAGKNSFPLFIIHFLIYIQIFPLVVTRTQLMTPAGAVLFLLFSLLGIMALGGVCDRLRLNRFWTVGLLALTKRWPILNRGLLITVAKADTLIRGTGPQLAAPARSPRGQQKLAG